MRIIKEYFPLIIKDIISHSSGKDKNQESFTSLQVRIQILIYQTDNHII